MVGTFEADTAQSGQSQQQLGKPTWLIGVLQLAVFIQRGVDLLTQRLHRLWWSQRLSVYTRHQTLCNVPDRWTASHFTRRTWQIKVTSCHLILTAYLTLWRPLLPYGTAMNHPVPDRVKQSFVFLTFGHSDAQPWASECRMPKITNDGLTRSGTGCFIAVPYGNSGRQRANTSCYSRDALPSRISNYDTSLLRIPHRSQVLILHLQTMFRCFRQSCDCILLLDRINK